MPLLARTMGTRENETCDALVGDIKVQDTGEGPIPYLEITDGKDSGSPRDVPFADLVLDMGFLEQRVIGRAPSEPLFPELIPQGPGKRRSAAFTDRFSYYRQSIKVYRARIDFHSFRGNVETDLKNMAGINQAWIDELIGHEFDHPPLRGRALHEADSAPDTAAVGERDRDQGRLVSSPLPRNAGRRSA